MTRFSIVILFISALLFLPDWAEARKITLNECITIALDNNQSIKASVEEKKKALAEYRVSLSQKSLLINAELKTTQYLKANASAITSAFNVPGVQTTIGLFFGLSATYSLFDAKKARTIKASCEVVKLSKYQYRKDINQVIYDVKEAYYGYLLSIDNMNFQKSMVKKNADKLKITQILFKNGKKPKIDVNQAHINYSNSQLDYERSKNNMMLMKMKLLAAMGLRKDDTHISVTYPEVLPVLALKLNDLYDAGDNFFPDLQMVRIQKRINKIKYSIEKARRYPNVDISFGFGLENKGISSGSFRDTFSNKNWKPAFNGGIVARFPVYSGGMIKGRVDSALSEYKKICYKENELKKQMKTMILAEFTTMKHLLKELKIALMVKEEAEKFLQMSRKMYRRGVGSYLELQNAQVNLIKTQLSYYKTKHDYFMSLSKLSKIVGVGEEHLCKYPKKIK